MERQIEKFYAKWGPGLLAFCCVLIGEHSEAEWVVVDSFQAYLSRGLDLELAGLPTFLFIFAIDAAKRTAIPRATERAEARRLEDAIVLLPWKERSVFTLRSVMGLDDMVSSEIVEIPVREVQRIWMNALFRLRELLHRDFFSGRKK